jgi:hypothetical protein
MSNEFYYGVMYLSADAKQFSIYNLKPNAYSPDIKMAKDMDAE